MGLSGGAIAGIVIGAVAAVAVGIVVLFWGCSEERKRQEIRDPEMAGKAGLGAVSSGKGDRFFSNLMPSFKSTK